MKKIILTAAAAVLSLGANAQQAQKHTNLKKDNSINSSFSVKQNGNNSVATTTCYTITPITASDTLTLYTIPTSTAMADAGYVTGNNGYGDVAKATFIPAALIPATGQITGVIAVFFQKTVTTGTVTTKVGTHGTGTVTVSVDILNGDTTAGPSTGTAVATATASLAAISAMTATNSAITYLFNLTTPVAAPTAGFFASLNLPATTGDTAVVFCTRDRPDHHNYAWDKNPGNAGTGWLAFSNASDWSLQTKLTLLPIICTTTGIKTNILETNIAYFPNPTTGEFNFAVALPEATTLTIAVTNTLGQTVFSKVENNISNSVLRYDLSSIGKGIYFVNITDSKNNMITKKVIVE
ncbi:MAG: T9SS type A sorting domain-containing protein [Bacteroidia bacterium]